MPMIELGAEETILAGKLLAALQAIVDQLERLADLQEANNQLLAIQVYRKRMEALQIADNIDAQKEIVFISDVVAGTEYPFSADRAQEVRQAWKRYAEEAKAKEAQEQPDPGMEANANKEGQQQNGA